MKYCWKYLLFFFISAVCFLKYLGREKNCCKVPYFVVMHHIFHVSLYQCVCRLCTIKFHWTVALYIGMFNLTSTCILLKTYMYVPLCKIWLTMTCCNQMLHVTVNVCCAIWHSILSACGTRLEIAVTQQIDGGEKCEPRGTVSSQFARIKLNWSVFFNDRNWSGCYNKYIARISYADYLKRYTIY